MILSPKSSPLVPAVSESYRIRACHIALGTSNAEDMYKWSQLCAWWDPQGKPMRPALETVRENVSFCFGSVYLLPQLTLESVSLNPHCWGVQSGGRAAWVEHWGTSLGLQSSDPAQPCPRGPMGNGAVRIESWGGSWSRQPKIMCSTTSRIKVSKHAIFQCSGFHLPFELVKWVGPIPKEILLVLPLHGLGSMFR